jgi:hypothetical protein
VLSNDVRHDKAIALWFNSTIGLVSMFAHRVPTRGPWVQFKKPVLENLPVLDTRKLDGKRLKQLADAYDAIAKEALQPLPAMATDLQRQAIDAAIRHTLGLPDLGPLRALLAQEPIISNSPLLPSGPIEDEGEPEQLAMF